MARQTREERNAKVREWRNRNIERERAKARARYAKDREIRQAYSREWYANNPEKNSEYWQKRKAGWTEEHRRCVQLRGHYGISNEEFEAMSAKQDGKCAICQNPPKEGKYLVVDHCHDTGNIRGLLCHSCNTGLGLLGDSAEAIQNAIDYLTEAQIPA